MEGFRAIPYIFLALAVAAVVGGAGAVTLSSFQGTITTCFNDTWTYNSSDDLCRNNSLVAYSEANLLHRNFSREYDIVWQGQDANTTVAGQLSTVGIIGIMVILIGLLSGVFVYFRYFK